MRTMDADDIEREVNNWEKNRWRRDIQSKTTLELYRSNRNINMGDGGVYTAMNMVRSCCFNVEPRPWNSDRGKVLKVEKWIVCCVEERRRS